MPSPRNGTSWKGAFVDLQEAVDAAAASGGGEVWVAKGVYDEARKDIQGALVLRENVHLYGGFVGEGEGGLETRRDQRDWKVNLTVIEGSREEGPTASHVIQGANGATLDGFVIKGGSAVAGSPDNRGGGLFNVNASPTVVHCTFRGNAAMFDGGAIYNQASSPTVTDCVFDNNVCGRDGGAIFNLDSKPVITRCLFVRNSADAGGAIRNHLGAPVIVNCVFRANTGSEGAAIHNGWECASRIINCTLVDNAATTKGGGLYNYASSPALINCILWGNSPQEIVAVTTDEFKAVPTVMYSDVQNGWPGTANINADPLFLDQAKGDLRLQAGSPCIDHGTAEGAPKTDFAGAARPAGSSVDMGAYEYGAAAPAAEPVGTGAEAGGASPAPGSTEQEGEPAAGPVFFRR